MSVTGEKCKYKCIYSNVDGISNKKAELDLLLRKERPDFVFITESKLNAEFVNTNIFNTQEYKVFRLDRPNQNAPGGGVVILVQKNLVCSEITLLNNQNVDDTPWCEIKCVDINIMLGVVYRPPSSPIDINQKLCDLLRLSEDVSRDSQILVCGDFNFGNILWEENLVQNGTQNFGEANKFLECINDNYWHQNVFEWTHMRDTDNPTRLDLVFTKTDCEIANVILL